MWIQSVARARKHTGLLFALVSLSHSTMSEVDHGPSSMEPVGSKHPFAVVGGVEASDERAEQDEEGVDGPSLHDVKRALRQNFRATGVIDDVTVRDMEDTTAAAAAAVRLLCASRRGNKGASEVSSYRSNQPTLSTFLKLATPKA